MLILSAAFFFSTSSCNAVADASLAFSYANASYSFRTLSWLSTAVLNSKSWLISGCIAISTSLDFARHDSISSWSSLLRFTLSIFSIGSRFLILAFTVYNSVYRCLMVSYNCPTSGCSCKVVQASTLSSNNFSMLLKVSEIFAAET